MIIAFVPCRLKSSRYPNKGIELINGITAIERCLINAEAIPEVDKVILATSTAPEDDALETCNLGGRVEVVRGPEEDVLERFMPAIKKYKPEHVMRITGDCPLVSPELASIIIEDHLKNDADASYTRSAVALGIASEIYKTTAVIKLRELFPQTLHSEYLIYYFSNNPHQFRLNEVDASARFLRKWRLTFDEKNDLDLMRKIYTGLQVGNRPVGFDEVISFFEKHPQVAEINIGNVVKYRDNKDLVAHLRTATTYTGV